MTTITERQERYRATRGYIGTGGIVICGACFDDQRFQAALSTSERTRFQGEEWERFNPGEGDDWCSICDRDITRTWRETG